MKTWDSIAKHVLPLDANTLIVGRSSSDLLMLGQDSQHTEGSFTLTIESHCNFSVLTNGKIECLFFFFSFPYIHVIFLVWMDERKIRGKEWNEGVRINI